MPFGFGHRQRALEGPRIGDERFARLRLGRLGQTETRVSLTTWRNVGHNLFNPPGLPISPQDDPRHLLERRPDRTGSGAFRPTIHPVGFKSTDFRDELANKCR
jgi:hypothetical protein